MLGKGLTGRVVVPSDSQYEQARQGYNKAINKYPAAIVYCLDYCDVANAILWSREQGVELRVRSGGHDYEGYSIGTCSLVIDTSPLNGIKINLADNTVNVQAGTRLLSLYEYLYKFGYTFPGGTCPTVAISGLVLGGGIGLSTRYLGLTADSLLEANMIDFAGRRLTANCCCNSELFWALKGAGGGNFGVVTDYKFKLKKVDGITVIQLRWDDNRAARNSFLQVWQGWLPHLDRRLSLFGGIYKEGAWVNAFFYGPPEEARQILQPLLNIPGLTLSNIAYVPFIEAVKIIGAMYPKREAFQAAGRFVQRHFSQAELEQILGIMDKAPSDRNSSIRVYSLGGAVRDIGAAETAFTYRQANYIIAIASAWEETDAAEAHREWVKAGFDYIYTITRGSYINFPYSQTPHYQQAYYGSNLRRLQCVKQTYDPYNLFRFPQSIELPL
ncbi:putative FAD-linked oxidoreductase YvdP [Sporomusa termitida]|uniref:Putative FAD-linked oxidoreductase YvdP n=1 Tax=Sporomusa termitida TaxID=2377 RepID=A0A517DZ34_9FIRM|nr:putative FAD-linked oxidoreductase YvdP [Sporomusa termitida]